MPLNEKVLGRYAAKGSLSKARGIVRDVELLERDGDSCTANVRGSSVYSVEVLGWDGDEMDGSCSCPDRRDGFCKHICAVLLVLIGNGPTSSAPVAPRHSPSTHSPKSLLPSVSSPQQAGLHHTNSGSQSELLQALQQYQATQDITYLAKLACLIYKSCKEASAAARYNPSPALNTMSRLASFYGSHNHTLDALPVGSPMNGAAGMIARSCWTVLSFSKDPSQVPPLESALNIWYKSANTRTKMCLEDAKQLASRKSREAAPQRANLV